MVLLVYLFISQVFVFVCCCNEQTASYGKLKQYNAMASDDNWKTQAFRQSVVSKIEEVIQRSAVQVARNSSEMENHVFMNAKTREEYMIMVAKLILHVREMSQSQQNQCQQQIQGPNQGQPGPSPQVKALQGQQQQGPNDPLTTSIPNIPNKNPD